MKQELQQHSELIYIGSPGGTVSRIMQTSEMTSSMLTKAIGESTKNKAKKSGRPKWMDQDFGNPFNLALELMKKQQSQQEEIKALKKEISKMKKLSNIDTKPATLIEILVKSNIYIKPSLIKRGMLLASNTVKEVQNILQSHKAIENKMANIQKRRRKKFIIDAKPIKKRIKGLYPTGMPIKKTIKYYSNVFGSNTLKIADGNMVFWINTELQFSNNDIICVHADGKFSKCVKTWSQSFELILDLREGDRVKKVTLAFSLLRGSKQISYTRFFKAVEEYKPLKFKVMVTDFEIGIRNAALSVWPNIEVRGCWFHYCRNLLKYSLRLKRWLKFEVSAGVMNVLKALPFLKYPAVYIEYLIQKMNPSFPNTFRNVDFKIIMYVYQTYTIKLKDIFTMNLSELLIRTNNMSEGKNSALSQAFSKKPSAEELADYISAMFKEDLAKKSKPQSKQSDYDKLLLIIQNRSEKHLIRLTNFLLKRPAIIEANATDTVKSLQAVSFKNHNQIKQDDCNNAENLLHQLIEKYNAFKSLKRKQLFSKIHPVIDARYEGNATQLKKRSYMESEETLANRESAYDEFPLDFFSDTNLGGGVSIRETINEVCKKIKQLKSILEKGNFVAKTKASLLLAMIDTKLSDFFEIHAETIEGFFNDKTHND